MTGAQLDHTHDPTVRSWVESANGHGDFPLQNLPLGKFDSDSGPRVGVAIGDCVVDLVALAATGLMSEAAADAACAASSEAPFPANAMLALPPVARQALRQDLFRLLSNGSQAQARQASFLIERANCRMLLPGEIGDFTDFNAGIHHAANGGRRRNLPNPLLPNYRHVPIAYHSRASSVRPSGAEVVRPLGQYPAGSEEDGPVFAPTRRLDFELELGIWVGRGNALGSRIGVGQAAEHIAGYCLLNDWSARDLQAWESQRLGPFLGKSFLTTVSPWVISPEALAPFRIPAFARTGSDPVPLAYLMDDEDQQRGGLGVELEVRLRTEGMRERGLPAVVLSASHAAALYWTPAQMLAHHASNGCPMRPGDLLGTGTISLEERDGFGTMLELSNAGSDPLSVGDETRAWLEDGDEITLVAHARRDGFAQIGFGECSGIVRPATHDGPDDHQAEQGPRR